jgi:peptidoglycan/LPS O-acetylase OafA/YrhL
VLSGFLITGILLETRRHPDYYRRFYIRRALRILPAYYAILFLVALVWRFGLSDRPESWAFLGLSSVYLANMTPLIGVPIYFGVLWSLAVEEHFYLIWPMCVRHLRRKGLVILAIALCATSLAARVAAFHLGHNVFGYYTWMVCDGLAMGALLAVAVRHFHQDRRAMWSIAAVALAISALSFSLEKSIARAFTGGALQVTGFNSFYAFVLISALLIGSRSGVRIRALEWVGDISYGVYLLHTLIFDVFDAMARRHFPMLAPEHLNFSSAVLRFAIVAIATLASAWLSRWYFEERFLRLKERFGSDLDTRSDSPLRETAASAGFTAA